MRRSGARKNKKCKGNFSARLCSNEQGGGASPVVSRRQKEKRSAMRKSQQLSPVDNDTRFYASASSKQY
jgi:hypothetical protein